MDFVKSKIERYFEILAERVGDLVPMAIDMYLVQRFGHDVSLLLANATHAFSDAHIHHLLQENVRHNLPALKQRSFFRGGGAFSPSLSLRAPPRFVSREYAVFFLRIRRI